MKHASDKLKRRGPRFARHECFVSENLKGCRKNAFIDSWPDSVKLIGDTPASFCVVATVSRGAARVQRSRLQPITVFRSDYGATG